MEKETKRRFFKRSPLSRAQRSLDSSSPLPAHSHAFETTSVTGLPALSSSPSSSHYSQIPSRPASAAKLAGISAAGPSNSLDENVITGKYDSQSTRFQPAPRRARSAERFDGMRIYSSPGDEMLPRNFRSPQLARNAGGGVGAPSGETLPRTNSSQASAMTMPSPPPPYSSAITDITGPPSYRQAVAAMTAAAQGKANAASARFAMAQRTAQSFDTGATGMPPMNSLRSASSVPAFSDDVICVCAKCQELQRIKDGGDYNDAVYMESQAFLMHEIMTDGMAFCSIM